ncbi:hypothetical protein SANBI_003712 [Sanguibacter sp. 4.1]|uniref:Ankyrin repeat domain-containing protein n=1 Tax=Sanguibacter biliveldensis TaxID=3030830 RepID=A0AAF0Z3J5_9MICO|nr:hypothetical protein [Sanguibacter sp. 4.1]WPF82358.1 hypothetical protein SANBI_003712 [Sanguibacter sp. 4.1]
MTAAFTKAKTGTLDEFLGVYSPSGASETGMGGMTLLCRALGNRHLDARVAIASRLLDDGADPSTVIPPDGYNALHILFGQAVHDPEAEAPLVRRLLDGGADVNAVAVRWGTPLQTLADNQKYADDELAPLYDELFARDDLDLLVPGAQGRSTLESARLLGDERADLVRRMEQYLTDRGVAVPEREV